MRIPLIILLVIIALVLIVSVLMQPSKTNGLQGFVGGGTADTYYSKNKAKTYEAIMARITVITAILFALDVIALNIIK
jgi:preprotein translocase subunit SecG